MAPERQIHPMYRDQPAVSPLRASFAISSCNHDRVPLGAQRPASTPAAPNR
jgi:hypothetical protein